MASEGAASVEAPDWSVDNSHTLGGANRKFTLKRCDGSRWMVSNKVTPTNNLTNRRCSHLLMPLAWLVLQYKDYSDKTDAYPIALDLLASTLARVAKIEYPETYPLCVSSESIKGLQTCWPTAPPLLRGSISRLYDNVVSHSLRNVPLERLEREAIVDLQTDFALNWMLSNGDGHHDNYLILANRRIACIDKTQSYKYFGNDSLDLDYRTPDMQFHSSEPYMHEQFKRYARGEMPEDLNLDAVWAADDGEARWNGDAFLEEGRGLTMFGKRVQAMQDYPHNDFAAAVQPYANAMHAKQRGVFASSAEDGIRLMLARKAILVSEMDRFFKELELQKEMAQGQRREHRQEQQRKVA